MSVFKRLAAWLDPEAPAAREESKAVILEQQNAINELTSKLEQRTAAHDKLIGATASVSVKAKTSAEALKKLMVELAVARSYVIDVVDDIDEQLATLPAKSKKRVPLEAMRAAVAADLIRINLALDEASQVTA